MENQSVKKGITNHCFRGSRYVLYTVLLNCIFLFTSASPQMLHPDKPDSGKKCAICHFQWVYPFYTEHRDGELVPQPMEKMVATAEMCFSCHDGSIADSRKIVFHDPGHREGVLPSGKITVPEDFPLDEGGRLQCSTCHTPHALASEAGVGVEVFLRSSDRESDLCRTCHRDKEGGPAKGNHSIAVSAKKQPTEIVGHGGRFGDAMPNEVICETCHIAHGGVNDQFLVLSAEDTSRSVLCISCHGYSPALSGGQGPDAGSHPVNIRAQNSRVPYRWSTGAQVMVSPQGELVCRTCHHPHGGFDKNHLLVELNKKDFLCVQCHQDKKLIEGSSHDLKIIVPGEKNIMGDRAADIGPCSPCHLVHKGSGKMMWARTKRLDLSPGAFCLSCHVSGESAEKVLPQDFSHPMDIASSTMTFARSKMKIRCTTCHDLHNPLPRYDDPVEPGVRHSKFLRYSDVEPSGVCIDCHPRYGLVKDTDHDLRLTAPDFENIYGETPQEGGLCSPCHVAHKARDQKHLWSASLGPSLLEGWNQPYTGDENMMTMLCTGCHSPGAVAEKHIPQFGLHPREKVNVVEAGGSISFEMSKNEFPIYTDEGDLAANGNIVCATCHNPHQWDPSRDIKGPGKPAVDEEGDATNSFLRPHLHDKYCTECHGEESIVKFKYFHDHTGRQKKEDAFSFE
jgi:predicted CXXCH cytochrome family protein